MSHTIQRRTQDDMFRIAPDILRLLGETLPTASTDPLACERLFSCLQMWVRHCRISASLVIAYVCTSPHPMPVLAAHDSGLKLALPSPAHPVLAVHDVASLTHLPPTPGRPFSPQPSPPWHPRCCKRWLPTVWWTCCTRTSTPAGTSR